MESNKKIGERIKKLREEKGETQAEVAKKLNVKRETVNHWENGERDLKTEYTIKNPDAFGAPRFLLTKLIVISPCYNTPEAPFVRRNPQGSDNRFKTLIFGTKFIVVI